MMMAIAAAMLLVACLRLRKDKITALDRKETARLARASEQACREWLYPFE